MRESIPLATCKDCGGRWCGGLYHAPHWEKRRGRHVYVNCIGKRIPKPEEVRPNV